MGNVSEGLTNLLGSLVGGGQSAINPMDILNQMGGINGPMTSPAGSMPATGTPADAVAEGVVSGWKPKKQGWFGAIADAYLMSQGFKPAYKNRVDEKNVMNAMEGFTQEPLEAVRRLAQIPGMQEKAWTLYNQITDNQRADGTLERQNRALDMRNDDYTFQQTASMMRAARPDTWGKMRELAIQRAQSRGVDVSHLIPNEYDEDSIEFMSYGAVKPKDLMTLEERERNNKERVALGRDRLNESTRYHNIQDQNADLTRDQRGDIAATNEAGRNSRSQRNPLSNKAYKDANGSLVEFNRTGDNIKVTSPAGNIMLYKMGVDGRKVLVWKGTKAEYDAEVAKGKK